MLKQETHIFRFFDISRAKIHAWKICENLAFFLNEAEVKPMGQKWEFGQTKNLASI